MHELCLEGMVKSVRCRLYNWQRYPTCRANGQIRAVAVTFFAALFDSTHIYLLF